MKKKVSIDGEIRKSEVIDCGVKLIKKASMTWRFTDLSNEHEILSRCFSENNLKKLVTLRELIKSANMIKEAGMELSTTIILKSEQFSFWQDSTHSMVSCQPSQFKIRIKTVAFILATFILC